MSNIKLFESAQIRSVWNDNEQKWFLSVIDIVGALTDSPDPKDYWYRIKKREKISGIELSTICRRLKLKAPDGKMRATDCADAEGLLRIIQSIPSPKAEPFKTWLARVGYERLEEIENPELSMERMQALYEKKGYPKEWIDKRMRGIAVRQDLTDEWKNRGATTSKEYAILTNEIMQGAFDLKEKRTVSGFCCCLFGKDNVKGGRGKQRPYEINVKTGENQQEPSRAGIFGVMWGGLWVRKLEYFA